MSKPIKMTDAFKNECRADFEKALELIRLTDGKVTFTKVFDTQSRKAKILFTSDAFAKMVRLVMDFDKEIAWHGVARRGDDPDKDEYIISDILVYPQKVTSSYVDMDTLEYSKWIIENDGDDRFSNIRMQGHSHVRMGTTPSGTDIQHQEDIVRMVGDDDFYIFMIWNKYLASTSKIFDLRKNTLFEDSDISWDIIGDGDGIEEFVEEAKKMVVDRPKETAAQYQSQNHQVAGFGPTTYQYNAPYDPYNKYKYEGKKSPEVATGGVVAKETTPAKTAEPTEKKRVRIGAGWEGAGSAPVDDSADECGYGYVRNGYPGYCGYSDEYMGGK